MAQSKKQSFQQLQEELELILDQLQSTDVPIDEAMNLHKQGEEIVKQLVARLADAKNEIVQLKSK